MVVLYYTTRAVEAFPPLMLKSYRLLQIYLDFCSLATARGFHPPRPTYFPSPPPPRAPSLFLPRSSHAADLCTPTHRMTKSMIRAWHSSASRHLTGSSFDSSVVGHGAGGPRRSRSALLARDMTMSAEWPTCSDAQMIFSVGILPPPLPGPPPAPPHMLTIVPRARYASHSSLSLSRLSAAP